MTTGDWIGVAIGLGGLIASVLLGIWNNRIALAQNEIFREQNKIFAAQADIRMPQNLQPPIKSRLYWPTFAAFLLAAGVGIVLAKIGPISIAIPWALVALLIFGTTLSVGRLKSSMGSLQLAVAESVALRSQLTAQTNERTAEPRLKIHSAKYSAHHGGDIYDVTECLRKMASGDSLVLQIQNGNFVAGGVNYVPKDPLEGKKKWLEVEYSFNGGVAIKIERREDYRVVLPEDTFMLARLESAQEGEKECTEKSWSIKEKLEEAENKLKLFPPLQMEALTLRRALIDFRREIGPEPIPERQLYPNSPDGEAMWLTAYHNAIIPWKSKLASGYELRFKDQARIFHHQISSLGVTDHRLGVLTLGPFTDERVPQLIEELWKVARLLEG